MSILWGPAHYYIFLSLEGRNQTHTFSVKSISRILFRCCKEEEEVVVCRGEMVCVKSIVFSTSLQARSILTTSLCPFETASLRGERPSLIPGALGFSVKLIKTLTTSVWPFSAASWIGVHPPCPGGLLYKKGFYTNNILKFNRVIILDTVLLPFKMQIFLHSSMLI